ncbi:PfkB family carbohydrate kinase [Candidatus Poriferisodalis sp.]|uniref:PfkB family carbohydrate kinase n=1 Tax=Candidatus Poriferisodalis sp. TaxID=3101277 RepID=UPI003D150E20
MIVSCREALVDLVPDAVLGGGPLNVAVAAARLGVPSAFVGRVSTDSYGEMIWAHLERNRVDVRACQRGSEPTARAIVEHTSKLSFRFEGDDTADACLDEVNLTVLGSGPHIVHGGTLGMFRGHTADVLASLWELNVAGRPAAMATLSTADWAGIGGRAAAVAAITCSRAGADPPYLDEL